MSTTSAVQVIAASEIPVGAQSSLFDLSEPVSTPVSRGILKVELVASRNGHPPKIRLVSDQNSGRPFFWCKFIQFAPDCHSQNVRLCRALQQRDRGSDRDPDSSVVVLQAVRRITIGEPLLLWFDEDLLVDAIIPSYLSPINIKSGNAKSYVCDKCGHTFEAPNQLKLHLALSCERYSIETIWARLASTSTSTSSGSPKQLHLHRQIRAPTVYSYSPSPQPNLQSQTQLQLLQPLQLTLPLDFSCNRTTTGATAATIVRAPYFVPPLAHVGALSLIASIRNGHNLNHRDRLQEQELDHEPPDSTSSSTPTPTSTPPSGTIMPRSSHQRQGENGGQSHESGRNSTESTPRKGPAPDNLQQQLQLQRLHPLHRHHLSTRDKVLAEQHAHLESLVSNMGKGKNGHVCLYCGKLYSRKYGLKIHIRTHTGYKPLACKVCHRPFGDPSNLNKHVRLHSDGVGQDGSGGGKTPYRCDICGKVLVRRRDLDRHIQSRHAAEVISTPGVRVHARRQELSTDQ